MQAQLHHDNCIRHELFVFEGNKINRFFSIGKVAVAYRLPTDGGGFEEINTTMNVGRTAAVCTAAASRAAALNAWYIPCQNTKG